MAGPSLLQVRRVGHDFSRPAGGTQTVLDDINFCINEREIVGLLGRSGCGKSTLLRMVTGLIRPTRGEVLQRGRVVSGPGQGTAMVFQSFALFPWLTVLQNVEAGLNAQLVPEVEARRRTLSAIELIGLNGFENAYPRELSGGMRQRVGLARALVVEPELLVMDEPFSALDVLTAETLRSDLVDLWQEGKLRTRSILIVTHNIEEAVFLCNRILLMSSNPGRISAEIEVPLPRPRDRFAPAFRTIVDEIYARMTAGTAPMHRAADDHRQAALATWLPVISAARIAGLAERIAGRPFEGRAELADLAKGLGFDMAALFRVAEVAQLLGFAELQDGALRLTPAGHALAAADIADRRRLFAEHLQRSVPLAVHIRRVLEERPGGTAPRSRFVDELEDHLNERDAEHTLSAVTGWGRYAGLFLYDHRRHLFSLPSEAVDGR